MKSQGFYSCFSIFIFLKPMKFLLVVNHVEVTFYPEGKKEVGQSNIQSDNCEMMFLFFTIEDVVHLMLQMFD